MADEQMDPYLIEALSRAGLLGQYLGLAGAGYGQGQEWAQTPTPQGHYAGGIYMAANPLEHLNAALRQIQGGQQMRSSYDTMRGLMDQYGSAAQEFYKWAQRQQAQQAQPQQAQPQQNLPGVPQMMGRWGGTNG